MNTYEILIVTAVLSGAACAWIAKEKGRSPVLWFLIGALLNVVIFAVIALVAMRKSATANGARR